MVLDVWGDVDLWIVKDEIMSYGVNGIGFVNFGRVGTFRSEKGITTFGLGARGFNQYDGTIENALFKEIRTYGDGSVGMQFSRPVGNITVDKGVFTYGSIGRTLVKGVIMDLYADAVSVLKGGEIERLTISEDLVTEGAGVVTFHINGGDVKEVSIGGKIVASGPGARRLVIENGGRAEEESIRGYL